MSVQKVLRTMGWASSSHSRTPSTAPLISTRHSRPMSTASDMDMIQERESNDDQLGDLSPGVTKRRDTLPPISEDPPPGPSGHLKTGSTQVNRDIESNANNSSKMRSIREFLMEEVDTAQAPAPLTAYCFMTGFIDAVCFSAVYVWCAFQTGNTLQLSLALARLFNGSHDYSFHIADRQALCSLLCFILGAFIGRIGDRIGCKTRMWMTLGTFIQTLLTMSAAITLWKSRSGSYAGSRGDPAWTDVLSFVTIGFMSASMGLQGIMGKRLNTQFTTTVVLTTTWCELMTEPQLFHLRRLVPSRDHKAIAILFLFLGGFISRALLDKIGSSATLGIGTGIRFVITLWWLFAPAKKASTYVRTQ